METEKLESYEVYASRYRRHLKEGLGRSAEDLYLMAAALRAEGHRHDELKALMLSFYFDLSGVASGPAVNRNTVKRAEDAVSALSIPLHEMEELYLDTIRQDTVPKPIMSPWDSLFIFEMCLEGRIEDADETVERFAKCAVT